jgi:hypothetical protein
MWGMKASVQGAKAELSILGRQANQRTPALNNTTAIIELLLLPN